MTGRSSQKRSYSDFWHEEIDDFDSIHLVRSTESYVVYLDPKDDIDWMTTDQYDQKGAEDQPRHNAILSEASVLECAPCHGVTVQTKRHYKRLVGEAIAFNFEDDYDNAQRMLREAQTYIRVRSEEISRRWYLSACAIMATIMIVLGLIIWFLREPISAALTPNFVWLCLAAVAGSCGALLSVIWRSGQLKFDCSAGEALHYLEGASRIWAGALSGVLVALAVKSQLVLAPLTHGTNTTTVIMLAAFVAGAGERLATSIISTFESTHPVTASRRDQSRTARGSNG